MINLLYYIRQDTLHSWASFLTYKLGILTLPISTSQSYVTFGVYIFIKCVILLICVIRPTVSIKTFFSLLLTLFHLPPCHHNYWHPATNPRVISEEWVCWGHIRVQVIDPCLDESSLPSSFIWQQRTGYNWIQASLPFWHQDTARYPTSETACLCQANDAFQLPTPSRQKVKITSIKALTRSWVWIKLPFHKNKDLTATINFKL